MKGLFLIGLILITLVFPSVSSAKIQVFPAQIEINSISPGETYTKTITVTRDTNENDTFVNLESVFPQNASWISLEPNTSLKVAKGERSASITLTITVPESAILDKYQGTIRVTEWASESSPGVSVEQGERINVVINVRESDTDLSVTNFSISDTQVGQSVAAFLTIKNTSEEDKGLDEVVLQIYSLEGELLESPTTNTIEKVSGNSEKTVKANFSVRAGIGEYVAKVEAKYANEIIFRDQAVLRIIQGAVAGISTQEGRSPSNNTLGKVLFITGVGALVFLIIVIVTKRVRKTNSGKKLFYIEMYIALILSSIFVIIGGWLLFGNGGEETVFVPLSKIQQKVNGESVKGISTQDLKIPETITAASEAKAYEKPSLESSEIAKLQVDTDYEVLEEKAKWYRVVLSDGSSGWVHKSQVKY